MCHPGRRPRPTGSAMATVQARSPQCLYLLLLGDADPGLDVGEGMQGGQDGVPPVLLMQLAPSREMMSVIPERTPPKRTSVV